MARMDVLPADIIPVVVAVDIMEEVPVHLVVAVVVAILKEQI